MYATKLVNTIYHLVLGTGQHTLCGLRVSRIPLGARLQGNLQLVEKIPSSKNICKHCERIRNQAA